MLATIVRSECAPSRADSHGSTSQWLPRAMRIAPRLDRHLRPGPVTPRHALLLNPFYAKDPHASFGKHVLTPSLALTSIAASTPADWTVQYWDENLLQGPPPVQPFPQVVGISVHLTFAERAYELARWYRQRGATIVFGGLHVLSCPDEVKPHADALVIGDGVQVWGQVLRDVETGTLQPVYHPGTGRGFEDSAPATLSLPRRGSFHAPKCCTKAHPIRRSVARTLKPDLSVRAAGEQAFRCGKVIRVDFKVARFDIDRDELVIVVRAERRLDATVISLLTAPRIFLRIVSRSAYIHWIPPRTALLSCRIARASTVSHCGCRINASSFL